MEARSLGSEASALRVETHNPTRVLLCGILALGVACSDEEPVQTFEQVLDDGSVITADIRYRLDGCSDGTEMVDCFYYMVTLHSPRPIASDHYLSSRTADLLEGAQNALARGADPAQVEEIFERESGRTLAEVRISCASISHVRLRFHDSEGFSLYRHQFGSGGNALEPGYNDFPDDIESIEGGMQWAGRFPATSFPLRQFRSDVSMTAEVVDVSGCPDEDDDGEL